VACVAIAPGAIARPWSSSAHRRRCGRRWGEGFFSRQEPRCRISPPNDRQRVPEPGSVPSASSTKNTAPHTAGATRAGYAVHARRQRNVHARMPSLQRPAAARRHRGCRTTWFPTHGWARSRPEPAALLIRLIPAFVEPHALSVKCMRALVNRPLGRGRRRSPNPGSRRNRGSTIDHPHRTNTQPQ
jgi:hypothetical protein